MRQMMFKLWNDDCGVAYKVEIIFVLTILGLGTLKGLVAVRQALTSEMIEFANALSALNQSYSFAGNSHCYASTAGSAANDTTNTIHDASTSASGSDVNQNPCD